VRLTGATLGIGSAVLFGAAMPLSKPLLDHTDAWMLAGLLYLGSGVGLGAYRLVARLPRPQLRRSDVIWLGGAILSGGIVAPVLLMFALARMSASGASLLLNAEGVFTALLAWLVFREHVGRRIAIGMILIAAGAITLSWPTQFEPLDLLPTALVLAACLAWAVDNNLTRRAADLDATWVAATKGLVAGVVNLALALMLGASLPPLGQAGMAMVVGLVTYGISLVLFVLALRQVGTARTGAYFSTAPFIGAILALLMGEQVDVRLAATALLMGFGVWLHLTERHDHEHEHAELEHSHGHVHDEHHRHLHETTESPGKPHVHMHRHERLRHKHPHFPDSHHLHRHD
jgi:drug/metabolite transporter (DMT)-like permease